MTSFRAAPPRAAPHASWRCTRTTSRPTRRRAAPPAPPRRAVGRGRGGERGRGEGEGGERVKLCFRSLFFVCLLRVARALACSACRSGVGAPAPAPRRALDSHHSPRAARPPPPAPFYPSPLPPPRTALKDGRPLPLPPRLLPGRRCRSRRWRSPCTTRLRRTARRPRPRPPPRPRGAGR